MLVTHFRLTLCSLAAASLLATACATSTPYQEPLPAEPLAIGDGEAVALDRVLVLFDASGSIHPKKTFPGGKAWVETFVQAMPEGEYDASVRSFGGDIRRGGRLTAFDREQLAGTAHGIRYIGDGSPLDAVLLEVASQIEGAGGSSAVVLVTDGVPDAPPWGAPPEPVLDAGRAVVEKSGGEVCFHTVLAGEDPAGKQLLQSLAKLTDCGSYRTAGTLGDAAGLQSFERDVFVGAAPVTAVVPVAAAVPTDGDSDGDGVSDSADECPGTPLGARVDERGCWVLESVRFASNSDEVVAGSIAEIVGITTVLAQNPELRVEIAGHTDSSGNAAYNQDLSERRARRVKKALVDRGIDASRLEAKGYGEENPIVDNSTPEGRADNRRIEFNVLR